MTFQGHSVLDIKHSEANPNIFEKSLAINKDLPKGHQLTFADLEAKKPKGYGILASQYKSVLGKSLQRDMQKWEFLNEQDINDDRDDDNAHHDVANEDDVQEMQSESEDANDEV